MKTLIKIKQAKLNQNYQINLHIFIKILIYNQQDQHTNQLYIFDRSIIQIRIYIFNFIIFLTHKWYYKIY